MRGPSEEALHRACAQLLWHYTNLGLICFTHPANGAYKSKATAGRMKAMGQTAGVPDLLIWAMGGKHLQVELKTTTGRLSPAQVAWIDRMTVFGFLVYVCRSVDELQDVLLRQGIAGGSGVVVRQVAGADGRLPAASSVADRPRPERARSAPPADQPRARVPRIAPR